MLLVQRPPPGDWSKASHQVGTKAGPSSGEVADEQPHAQDLARPSRTWEAPHLGQGRPPELERRTRRHAGAQLCAAHLW